MIVESTVKIMNEQELHERLHDAEIHPLYGAYYHLPFNDPYLRYHLSPHTTEDVVRAADILAHMEFAAGNLKSLDDILMVGIAARFHDTGFFLHDTTNRIHPDKSIKEYYDLNEPFGSAFAEQYMEKCDHPFTLWQIQVVRAAILNTDMRNKPGSTISAIVRDADLSYLEELNTQKFLKTENSLKIEVKMHEDSRLYKNTEKEMERILEEYKSFREFWGLEKKEITIGNRGSKNYDALWDYAWHRQSLFFMQHIHEWFTDSAKRLYTEAKEINRRVYKKQLRQSQNHFIDNFLPTSQNQHFPISH